MEDWKMENSEKLKTKSEKLGKPQLTNNGQWTMDNEQ
jgi:hypothetical protein